MFFVLILPAVKELSVDVFMSFVNVHVCNSESACYHSTRRHDHAFCNVLERIETGILAVVNDLGIWVLLSATKVMLSKREM